MLKDLLGETIQIMLEGEIEEELGYSKYNYDEKNTQNTRNSYSPKKVRSEYGEVELNIPWDRNNEFEPQIIPKYQREITDKILPEIKEWQTRQFEEVYPIVGCNTLQCEIRWNSNKKSGIYTNRNKFERRKGGIRLHWILLNYLLILLKYPVLLCFLSHLIYLARIYCFHFLLPRSNIKVSIRIQKYRNV